MLLALVVAFAGGCGEEEDPASSADEEVAVQDTTEQETEPAEDSATPVGEPVTVGDVQWTVTDAQQTDIIVSRLGSEEGSFVYIDVTFSNNSNQDVTLATPFLVLLDSEGREYEADIESNFTHIDPEKNMFAGHVEPGATKEGRIIYAVAPDASGFKLQVGEARFASGETEYIDLGF